MARDLTVIKVGTGVLTQSADGRLNRAAMFHLTAAIASLIDRGHACLFVSSGAVGSGISSFGLEQYPGDTATRQACAAVGQAKLMQCYSGMFENFDITVAQVLLTAADLATHDRAALISSTLNRLMSEARILPIINENDSVAVDELKFGDNDLLSAQVAKLAGARRLILLTTVDGLINPASGEMMHEIEDVNEVMQFASDDRGRFSMGGMTSKLQAVKFAVDAGIETHIANGRHPERIAGILSGHGISTRFAPQMLG